MRYTDLNSSLEAHISTLRAVIAVLILIILGLWAGWHGSNNDVRIHIPPDLRSGAILKADEISSAMFMPLPFTSSNNSIIGQKMVPMIMACRYLKQRLI